MLMAVNMGSRRRERIIRMDQPHRLKRKSRGNLLLHRLKNAGTDEIIPRFERMRGIETKTDAAAERFGERSKLAERPPERRTLSRGIFNQNADRRGRQTIQMVEQTSDARFHPGPLVTAGMDNVKIGAHPLCLLKFPLHQVPGTTGDRLVGRCKIDKVGHVDNDRRYPGRTAPLAERPQFLRRPGRGLPRPRIVKKQLDTFTNKFPGDAERLIESLADVHMNSDSHALLYPVPPSPHTRTPTQELRDGHKTFDKMKPDGIVKIVFSLLKGAGMKKIRVGVIGVGGIAQFGHITAYQKEPDVELIAAADPNIEKLEYVAGKFSIPRTFPLWEDMLKLNLDAVSICSPNVFHAPQSIAALNAGINVLCEKPVCLTASEAKKILAAAKSNGKVFMAAFPRRFNGETKTLKPLIEKGFFGDIYYVKATVLRRRGIPGPGTWFTNKKLAGGGPMMDVGVHLLDWAIHLIGAPQPQIVMGRTYMKFNDRVIAGGWPPAVSQVGEKPSGPIDVEDFATGYVLFANGATLSIEASWAGNTETAFRLTIVGTKAGVQMPDPQNPNNPIRIYSEINGTVSDSTLTIPQGDMFQEEINHFVECVRTKKQPITTPGEILSVVRTIESLYTSARTGKPVTVGGT